MFMFWLARQGKKEFAYVVCYFFSVALWHYAVVILVLSSRGVITSVSPVTAVSFTLAATCKARLQLRLLHD
jgi:hypothetical protein